MFSTAILGGFGEKVRRWNRAYMVKSCGNAANGAAWLQCSCVIDCTCMQCSQLYSYALLSYALWQSRQNTWMWCAILTNSMQSQQHIDKWKAITFVNDMNIAPFCVGKGSLRMPIFTESRGSVHKLDIVGEDLPNHKVFPLNLAVICYDYDSQCYLILRKHTWLHKAQPPSLLQGFLLCHCRHLH